MLKNLLNKKSSGFTLIEVVIVLAIAGLIFVIVFLAVSQTQAARRDTQRKSIANQVLASVNQYASNNNGSLPAAASPCSVLDSYTSTLTDPDGGTITLNCISTNAPAPNNTTMVVGVGKICGASGAFANGSSRQYAVAFYQERGGTVCQAGQ